MKLTNKRLLLPFFALIIFASTTFGQIMEPVKWKSSVKKINDTEAELLMTATMDDGWHLYSQFIQDGGPVPTEYAFEANENYELIGKVIEPKPIEEEDPNFDMVLKYFGGKATFKQKIKLKTDKAFKVIGEVYFMCCDDKQCLSPTTVDFEFSIPASKKEEVVAKENNEETENIDDKNQESSEAIAENPDSLEKDTAEKEAVTHDVKVDSAEVKEAVIGKADEKKAGGGSLWSVIIEAILWGFAALLTPCVFPMVPMTVSFFMKGGENKAKGKVMASTFGISIVALYTLPIAAIIFITYFVGGEAVTADIFNWLSTHWLPNILFFLIFMIFAASFFGMFEIVLPSWMVSRADSKADKGGMMGAFFMALTLVLVSFSCTGPIVGTIIVKSTQGEIWEPIITMLAFSAAFALPFTLLAFFPSWMKNMPKSGGWLNSVKVVLGFIEVALGFKFLSVADQVYHWGILDREVYLAIWIVTFSLLGFYLLGKLKFKHDSDLKFIPVPRLGLAIISFVFVVYMIPGMWGAPLKALSGYMPPKTTMDFDIDRLVRSNSGGAASTQAELCDAPKFSDFLHLPHGLYGYFDIEQALKCSKEQNKPLFIDFTGHGCVNCREMEANVWSDPRVLKRLKEDFIVTALYVDDKTKLPEEEWVTSKKDKKVKKTVGRKYADYQIVNFETNAQPYYVIMGAEEELLENALVTPTAYDLNVENFIEFLDKGLEEYNKKYKK